MASTENGTANASAASSPGSLRFALVPKSVDNPFFDIARDGCVDRAAQLSFAAPNGQNDATNVTCWYTGPSAEANDSSGEIQASMVADMIQQYQSHLLQLDGLAISVQNQTLLTPLIQQAIEAGLPVVTFDSDAPESARIAYVGTDNYFFGQQLAKLVRKLVPTGGTYATLAASAPNLQQRLAGFLHEIQTPQQGYGAWTALPGSPADTLGNVTLAMDLMDQFALQNPTVLAPVLGAPMRSGLWKAFVDRHRFRNITLVCGDALPTQLEFLDRHYVDGLVGQLPYEMGFEAISLLYMLKLNNQSSVNNMIIGTNVLTHVQIPLVLPELQVNNNLIGNLSIVGYLLFGMVAATALCASAWTYRLRTFRVVKLAQPFFLIMVASGVLVMASALIPLSMDDGGHPDSMTGRHSTVICMSVPWLAFCGFTITFSALYSKTFRVNRVLQAAALFRRVNVTVVDVMVPFCVLFSANLLVLALWTALDPLTYVRQANAGLDGWGRIISTFGSCRSHDVQRYLIPLGLLNVGVLVMANWQAYKSRRIDAEFSESKYIALTMGSLLQATLTGIPILFVVKDSPDAYYLVMSFMIFIISMAVLLLIFGPKMVLAVEYGRHSQASQRAIIHKSLARASQGYSQQEASRRPSDPTAYPDDHEAPLEKIRGSLTKRLSRSRTRETNGLSRDSWGGISVSAYLSSPSEMSQNSLDEDERDQFDLPSRRSSSPSSELAASWQMDAEADTPSEELILGKMPRIAEGHDEEEGDDHGMEDVEEIQVPESEPMKRQLSPGESSYPDPREEEADAFENPIVLFPKEDVLDQPAPHHSQPGETDRSSSRTSPCVPPPTFFL